MPQTLFKKGKKSGGKSSLRSEHDDIWDDSLLIKAYEESIRLQKEDVAKQIAMKTNKKLRSDENESSESSSEASTEVFKVGDFVRSTFADDGVDYEAEVLAVNENETCLIRYIGYGNEERVKMEELVASWGPEAREEQRILSEADQQGSSGENCDHQDGLLSFVASKAQGFQNSLPIPPMPAMPPGMFDSSKDSEYMSAMLMSWYMSGYYTGLYHGRKQAKEEVFSQSTSNVCPNSASSDKESPRKKKKTRKCRT